LGRFRETTVISPVCGAGRVLSLTGEDKEPYEVEVEVEVEL
jgi:hypothetical protein